MTTSASSPHAQVLPSVGGTLHGSSALLQQQQSKPNHANARLMERLSKSKGRSVVRKSLGAALEVSLSLSISNEDDKPDHNLHSRQTASAPSSPMGEDIVSEEKRKELTRRSSSSTRKESLAKAHYRRSARSATCSSSLTPVATLHVETEPQEPLSPPLPSDQQPHHQSTSALRRATIARSIRKSLKAGSPPPSPASVATSASTRPSRRGPSSNNAVVSVSSMNEDEKDRSINHQTPKKTILERRRELSLQTMGSAASPVKQPVPEPLRLKPPPPMPAARTRPSPFDTAVSASNTIVHSSSPRFVSRTLPRYALRSPLEGEANKDVPDPAPVSVAGRLRSIPSRSTSLQAMPPSSCSSPASRSSSSKQTSSCTTQETSAYRESIRTLFTPRSYSDLAHIKRQPEPLGARSSVTTKSSRGEDDDECISLQSTLSTKSSQSASIRHHSLARSNNSNKARYLSTTKYASSSLNGPLYNLSSCSGSLQSIDHASHPHPATATSSNKPVAPVPAAIVAKYRRQSLPQPPVRSMQTRDDLDLVATTTSKANRIPRRPLSMAVPAPKGASTLSSALSDQKSGSTCKSGTKVAVPDKKSEETPPAWATKYEAAKIVSSEYVKVRMGNGKVSQQTKDGSAPPAMPKSAKPLTTSLSSAQRASNNLTSRKHDLNGPVRGQPTDCSNHLKSKNNNNTDATTPPPATTSKTDVTNARVYATRRARSLTPRANMERKESFLDQQTTTIDEVKTVSSSTGSSQTKSKPTTSSGGRSLTSKGDVSVLQPRPHNSNQESAALPPNASRRSAGKIAAVTSLKKKASTASADEKVPPRKEPSQNVTASSDTPSKKSIIINSRTITHTGKSEEIKEPRQSTRTQTLAVTPALTSPSPFKVSPLSQRNSVIRTPTSACKKELVEKKELQHASMAEATSRPPTSKTGLAKGKSGSRKDAMSTLLHAAIDIDRQQNLTLPAPSPTRRLALSVTERNALAQQLANPPPPPPPPPPPTTARMYWSKQRTAQSPQSWESVEPSTSTVYSMITSTSTSPNGRPIKTLTVSPRVRSTSNPSTSLLKGANTSFSTWF